MNQKARTRLKNILTPLALTLFGLPLWASGDSGAGDSPLLHMVHTAAADILSLGFILALAVGAKIACESKYLKQPAVLGYFIAGVIISNIDLLAVKVPFFKPLSDGIDTLLPVHDGFSFSPGIWTIGAIGVVLLLLLTGMEVNFEEAKKVGLSSGAIAIGGVVFPFGFTVLLMIFLPQSWWFHQEWIDAGLTWSDHDPLAVILMFATTSVATSVGVTAAVYKDLGVLDSREGLVVLMAGIWDDIIGLLVLTGVLLYATAKSGLDIKELAIKGGLAILFLVVIISFRLFSGKLSKGADNKFGRYNTALLMIAVVFLVAAVSEIGFGLAMIVGAAVFGLAFAGTSVAHFLEESLLFTKDLLAPVFFVVMGMLSDFNYMFQAMGLAIAFTICGYLGKILGCGIVARFFNFTKMESLRIGLGMNNRGEVGFIAAGIGLAAGILDAKLFGAAVFMIFVTTAPTPPMLKALFASVKSKMEPVFKWVDLPHHLLRAFRQHLEKELNGAGFKTVAHSVGDLYEFSNGEKVVTLAMEEGEMSLETEEPILILEDIVANAKANLRADLEKL